MFFLMKIKFIIALEVILLTIVENEFEVARLNIKMWRDYTDPGNNYLGTVMNWRLPRFTFSPFTRDPNLQQTKFYSGSKFTHLQIYSRPKFTRNQIYPWPKFTRNQIYTDPNLHKTHIYQVPNIHKPKFTHK